MTQNKKKGNIVLIGYRGTGKTTIGSALGSRLNMHVISTDLLVEEKMKMNIQQIVNTYGWDKFRETESLVIKEIQQRHDCIIDCGGGVVERKANIERIRTMGAVILLEASVEDILARIKGDDGRPPHNHGCSIEEEVVKTLKDRKNRYESLCDLKINTSEIDISSNAGIDTVAAKIIRFCAHKGFIKGYNT